ncbi:MAG: hypothetical protein DRR19_20400 [Candidatus Parabeggiatoa sp. nov. 1]|nr:MAG: hypothetical protein DRR19_20400 [Gammaproteobacteria bacterium]
MTLHKIIQYKNSLPRQYLTDEAGTKKAIILSMSQFDEIFDKMTSILKFAESPDNSASVQSQSTTEQATQLKPTAGSGEENTSEHIVGLLKQHYELLNDMLGNWQNYKKLGAGAERKLQLQKIISDLDTEVKTLRSQLGEVKKQSKPATLHYLPELPNNLVQKGPLFNKIRDQLLAKATNQKRPPLVLQAPSGTGKSVMAATLAQVPEIRLDFPDGIFWFRLGTDADLPVHQTTLFQALGETTVKEVVDVEEAAERLRELCATQACMVILDDVGEAQDVLAFNIVGEHCQLLITTSDSNVLDIIQYFISTAIGYELKPFSEKQAIAFFLNCVGNKKITAASVPVDMADMVQACDSLPLALKLMANVARNHPPSNWKALLDRLQEDDGYEFSDKYPRSLMRTLHLNIEALGEPGDYYIALAVFSDYSRIPQSVVLKLWHYLYQLQEDKAIAFINQLADKGLLELYDISSQRYLSLHSFQHDYLAAEAELEKLHGHLLTIYRRQCAQHGWISGPNDGYFFEYLCMHLHHAGRHNELKPLLLDFDWMLKKLQATSVHALLNDYEWLEDKNVERIKKTLSEAAMVLVTNKQELPIQLLDRLWGNKSLEDNKDIQAILHQAKEAAPQWRWQPHFKEEK